MTVGELDFNSLFRQSPNGESESMEEIHYIVVSIIVWITFIVIMPILLINMLVSTSYFSYWRSNDKGKYHTIHWLQHGWIQDFLGRGLKRNKQLNKKW